MPVVPYRPQPQVTPTGLPTVRQNPTAPLSAFGGTPNGLGGNPDLSGVTTASLHLADQQERIAEEERLKANHTAVQDAASQMVDFSTHKLNGTPDADGYAGDPGVLRTYGKDAFDAVGKARNEWNAVATTLRNQLTNDDQKMAFDSIELHERDMFNEQVERHVAQQRQVYQKQSADAIVQAKGDQAIASFDKPEISEPAIEIQKAALADRPDWHGMPPEAQQQLIANTVSKTRLGILRQYLDSGQVVAASAYFDKYKEQFMGGDNILGTKLTDEGKVVAQSQQHADEILHSATTLPDAVAAAHAITEPKVRDATETRVRRFFSDQAADLRQQRESSFFGLSAKLAQNGGNVDRLKTTPDWLAITPQDQTALERRAFLMAHPREGPGDKEAYLTLLNQAYFDPDAFMAQDLQHATGLNVAQTQHLLTKRDQLQKQDLASILTGMKGKREPVDTTGTTPLNTDPALQAALGIGGPPAASSSAHATPSADPLHIPGKPTPDGRSASNPLGLSEIKKTTFTGSMLADLVRASASGDGDRYAGLLQHLNVDLPADWKAVVAAEQAKAAQAKAGAKKP